MFLDQGGRTAIAPSIPRKLGILIDGSRQMYKDHASIHFRWCRAKTIRPAEAAWLFKYPGIGS